MAKEKIIEADNSVVFEKPLEQVLHESMIPYSESVILERALPRVEDGLKPVQRRVLYSMYELDVTPDKPHRKCARIVGDCLGKYHPHGDSSVYGALVRMAQSFSMRMPLVDGHGNFGSVDGDGPAAMRYTEARLMPLAVEMLKDLDKDTVEMQWNFDDTIKEPVTLPARFPNLLVNGVEGIAIGLSSHIPPHNLGEVIDGTVALIDKPKMKLEEIMTYIKGPDFPTGGTIVMWPELVQAYETGKGKVKVRAKAFIEDDTGDKKNIVITEIPYQLKKSDILTKILKLREAKKESCLQYISDIVDESDRTGMRAVIKVKKDGNAEQILRYLFKQTDLEINYNFNMVAIAGGKPCQLGLIEILQYYVDYHRQVIVRRATYDLKAARLRAEIVEGLLIAIKNIDEVIKIIKKSPTTAAASEALKKRFELTDRQTQAILEMKLRRLTGLDVKSLEDELVEQKKRIEDLTALLQSRRRQNSLMQKELLEIKKTYKSPRLTDIKAEGTDIEVSYHREDEVAYKEGVLVLGENGGLKFVTNRSFGGAQRRAADNDQSSVVKQAVSANNKQKIFAFSDLGNCFRLSLDELPEKKWREQGASIGKLNKAAGANEKIVKVFAVDVIPEGDAVMFTASGMVKRTPWQELDVQKNVYKVINLADGDNLMSVETVEPEYRVFMATEQGMCLTYENDEIPTQGRNASGVKGIKLSDGDRLLAAMEINDEGEIVVVTDGGYAKRVLAWSFDSSKRYNKGVKLVDLLDKTKVALVSYVKFPYDVMLVSGENVYGFSTDDIALDSRTGRGKALVKGKNVKAYKHVADVLR